MVLCSSIEKLHFFSFYLSQIFQLMNISRGTSCNSHGKHVCLILPSHHICLTILYLRCIDIICTTDLLGKGRGTLNSACRYLIGCVFNPYIIFVFSADRQTETMRKADLIVSSQVLCVLLCVILTAGRPIPRFIPFFIRMLTAFVRPWTENAVFFLQRASVFVLRERAKRFQRRISNGGFPTNERTGVK